MTRKVTLLIISLLVLSVTLPCSAQFRYGPTVGVSLNDLHFKQDLFDVDKTVGYSAGIAAEMLFPGVGFGIDLGLFYEQRGAKLHLGQKEMWASQGLSTEQMRLHSIVLPLHLRFKYTRLNGVEDRIAPFAYAGPSFGFIAAHSKVANTMDYAGADLCMDFGVGAELFRHWQVSVSYTMGLTYAMKAKILTNFSARNRIWALRAAYLF